LPFFPFQHNFNRLFLNHSSKRLFLLSHDSTSALAALGRHILSGGNIKALEFLPALAVSCFYPALGASVFPL
jgi:hypothetical protein